MNKKLFIFICCAALLVTGAQAGLFKNSVDLADLSELPSETLEELKDPEFAVFIAEVRLNAAKAAERRAAGAVKATNQTLEAEKLDQKAANAESKAARANMDDDREIAATARIAGAEEDLATAKALLKWKTQEKEARQAQVAMAKSELDLAEANRDLARLRLLTREAAKSIDKYDLGDFERNAQKRQKEFEAASRKAEDKLVKLDKLKIEWERLAKNIDLSEAD